jgi:hypothetical protein
MVELSSAATGRSGAVSGWLRAAHHTNWAVILAIGVMVAQGAPQGMPPAPDDNGYPPGLFENSPVIDPDAPKAKPHDRNGNKKHRLSSEGSCHHYRDWHYPYPQPC